MAKITAPEALAPLAAIQGNPAAPQEKVDAEAAAVQNLKEAMKVRSGLHLQVGAKRKAVSVTTPITSV